MEDGIRWVRSRGLRNIIRHASVYNIFPRRDLACGEAVRRQLVESGVRVLVQYPPVEIARFGAVFLNEKGRVRREFGLVGCFPIVACAGEFRVEKRPALPWPNG